MRGKKKTKIKIRKKLQKSEMINVFLAAFSCKRRWQLYFPYIETVFLNFLKEGLESIPPANVAGAQIYQHLRSPGIDHKESILAARYDNHIPTTPSQGWFFNHDGMYARNRQLPLCVNSVDLTPYLTYGVHTRSRAVSGSPS
jgi:hypothetical protein